MVQLVNFTCFGESPAPFKTTPAPCVVSLLIPAGKQVTAATLSSPDAASPARVPVPWKVVDGRATMDLTVIQYSLLTVTMASTGAAAARTPVEYGDAGEAVQAERGPGRSPRSPAAGRGCWSRSSPRP